MSIPQPRHLSHTTHPNLRWLTAVLLMAWMLISCGGGGGGAGLTPLSSAKDISAFSVSGVTGTITGSTIAVALPFETSLTALPAEFVTTGALVHVGSVAQTSGVTMNDYSKPVVYVVTAADGSTKQYKVSVVSTYAAAQVSFKGDWENGLTGVGNWGYIETMAANRFQLVTNPVRKGSHAARVEVRPGDDPIKSSGERSEVSNMTDAMGNVINEGKSSGIQYFSFSVRLDTSWQDPVGGGGAEPWAAVFQLHGPNVLGIPPAIAISVQKEFNLYLHTGDFSINGKYFDGTFPFANSNLNLGRWVDLVMKIKFATDFTGVVTVWRRDEGQTSYSKMLDLEGVPTLQYKSSLGPVGLHYWKHGFYRSKETAITNILWLDDLTRYNFN